MNRKAVSFLGNYILMITALLVSVVVIASFVKPLLNSDSKTTSYESFNKLVLELNSLLDYGNGEKTAFTYIEMSNEYSLIGFDHHYSSQSAFNVLKQCDWKGNIDHAYTFPSECEPDKACLCLFKTKSAKKVNVVKCESFDEEIEFYTSVPAGLRFRSEGYEEFMGCKKTGYTEIIGLNHGIPNLEYRHLMLGGYTVIKDSVNNKREYKDYSHNSYIEILKIPMDGNQYIQPSKNIGPRFDIDRLNLKNTVQVLITSNDEFSDVLRYKLASFCPVDSDADCVGKHFDEVVDDPNGKFYCDFSYEDNKCLKVDQFENCPPGEIKDVCECETIIMNEGFCMFNKVVVPDYEEEAAACDEYTKETNCLIDYFGFIPDGCLWDSNGNDCELCPDGNNKYDDCDDYKDKISCNFDSCRVWNRNNNFYCEYNDQSSKCELTVNPDSNYCLNTGKDCVIDFSGQAPGIPNIGSTIMKCDFFDEYQTKCKRSLVSLDSNCQDFYVNTLNTPNGNAQINADPCDCDFDGKFPDTSCDN